MKANIFTKLLSISTVLIAVLLALQLFTYSSEPTSATNNPNTKPAGNYAIFSLDIPENIEFAGEPVPIHRYDVKESLDRELLINTYWQSQTILFIKRANRYFPVIEPILKEYGVPDDFKYLSIIESGLMPRATSPADAVGLWQFMKATAKEYGLEVNNEIDERYHIEKSTIAACKYLKKAHDHYGNWTLAAASYNAGRTGMNKQMDRQKTNNYYDLLLGEETGRYVFRIIATKEILFQPDQYGFHVKPEDLYPAIETFDYEISDGVADFADFALKFNTTYKELKDLNPWLRESFLTNAAKTKYIIKLPVKSQNTVDQAKTIKTDSTKNQTDSTLKK